MNSLFEYPRKKTASSIAKENGLKSLKNVSDISGVSVQTLNNWHKNKYDLFLIVIAGCSSYLTKKSNTNHKQ